MKYLGIFITIIGAVILMLSYMVESMNNNASLVTGAFLVVGGFIAHIVINKVIEPSSK